MLVTLARERATDKDPVIRQGLAKLHILNELGRFNTERMRAARAAGRDIPGLPNIAKLSMSEMMRLSRDLGTAIAGPAGTLHAYHHEDRATLEGLPSPSWSRPSPAWPSMPRPRPSTAAPTRSRRTSSANGSSGCPRSRTTTAPPGLRKPPK